MKTRSFASLVRFAAPIAAMAAGLTAAPAHAEVKFQSNGNAAMAQSAKLGKPMMVDVYTDWCGWCKKLDADVYSQPSVSSYVAKNFVAVKLNPEKDATGKAWAQKYNVHGFPTILFIDGKGRLIDQIVGYEPAPDFLKSLQAVKAKSKTARVAHR